jgi:hypothetical protein
MTEGSQLACDELSRDEAAPTSMMGFICLCEQIAAGKPLPLTITIDMAAKRRKKHKNNISGCVISICYHKQKSVSVSVGAASSRD